MTSTTSFLQRTIVSALLLVVLWPPAIETSAFTTAPVATTPGRQIIPVQILNASPQMENEPSDNNDTDFNIQRRSQRLLVPGIALVTLLTCTVAAKIGLLPGPQLAGGGGYGQYTDAMIWRDVGSTLLTSCLGYAFVKANTWAAAQGYVDPPDSRKIIHVLSAPLFIVFWPLFSDAEGARFFAASVSFVNVIRLYIAGSGGDKSLAFAVSRSGDQREALGGPFLYVVILFFSIILFWRDGPIGVVALSAMAAGDGLADLVGRRYGKGNKWWFNPDKSIAGTSAFWIGATACAWTLLKVLSIDLQPALPLSPELILTGIMAITALLEIAPIKFDDNYVVPLSAAALTAIAFT